MLYKLVQSGGMNAIARQLGETHSVTLASARELLPGLLARLRDYPGGIAALLELFAGAGGIKLAADIMGPDRTSNAPGEAIIARIGGIVVSPQDAGLVPDDAKLRLQVAPLLTMLVAGYLSARAAESAMSIDDLEALLVAEDYKFGSLPDEPV